MIEECSGQEENEVRTFVKDVFKISKIMAFAAKDNCPENQWTRPVGSDKYLVFNLHQHPSHTAHVQ